MKDQRKAKRIDIEIRTKERREKTITIWADRCFKVLEEEAKEKAS